METRKLLTIQDLSCLGQCSLGVAIPIISCLGAEVCAIPTAVLSTHTTGFVDYTFRDLTDDLPNIIRHWDSLNVSFDAVYSGYIANIKQLEIIQNIFDHYGDNCIKVVDPVMGDHGKMYNGFTLEFANKMKDLCAKADVLVPNYTEACLLLGEEYNSDDLSQSQVESMLKKLANLGAKHIIMSGVSFDNDQIGASIYDAQKGTFEYCFAKKIKGSFQGTGDIFASVIAGSLVRGDSLQQSVQLAVDFVSTSLEKNLNDKNKHSYGVNFESNLQMLCDTYKY